MFGHVLGDGESLLLDVTLADGSEPAASVYVDHHLGTVLKDALVVPGALPNLIVLMQDTSERRRELIAARERFSEPHR